ncbi:MAG: hypothetical protein V4496_03310 [Pseudomonadota bacterium]
MYATKSSQSHKREALGDAYLDGVLQDKLPAKGSELEQLLRTNPRLLRKEIDSSRESRFSVISAALVFGSLHFADFILKKDSQMIAEADLFYCGKTKEGVDTLRYSAGLNIYCALYAFDFYVRQRKLSELIEYDELGKLIAVKKTHYDCFYWEDENNVRRHASLQEKANEINGVALYAETVAPWFMKIAYGIFQANNALNHAASKAAREDAHETLGKYYLTIAYMENHTSCTFNYFLKKAEEHYTQSSIKNQALTQKLQQYGAFAKEIFKLQLTKQQQDFSSRAPTLAEWKKAYDEAMFNPWEYIIDDKMVSRQRDRIDDTSGVCETTTEMMVNGILESETVGRDIIPCIYHDGPYHRQSIYMTSNPLFSGAAENKSLDLPKADRKSIKSC